MVILLWIINIVENHSKNNETKGIKNEKDKRKRYWLIKITGHIDLEDTKEEIRKNEQNKIIKIVKIHNSKDEFLLIYE